MTEHLDHTQPFGSGGQHQQQQRRQAKKDVRKEAEKREFMRFRTRDVFISEDLKRKKPCTYADDPILRQKLLAQQQKLKAQDRSGSKTR